jgi:hypothetical protein
VNEAPSVLLLDDGELDRVHSLLGRMGADCVRLQGREIGGSTPRPRDLLVTSGPRALELPRLAVRDADAPEPVWVCVHGRDLPAVRDRLRALGVHYVVREDVDDSSLRLLLLQILFRGAERRHSRRLPLRVDIEVEVGVERWKARLIELSRTMCRFATERDVPEEELVLVRLPETLTGGAALEFAARPIRSSDVTLASGARARSVVVGFESLDVDARAQLNAIFSGERVGTSVTPLADVLSPGTDAESETPPEVVLEAQTEPVPEDQRRVATRHPYTRRVEALHWEDDGEGPRIALGRDLSVSGVRMVWSPPPRAGARVTLALYGGPREEPVVVNAEVVRAEDEETCLRFLRVSASQGRALEKLACGEARVEALDRRERVVVTRMLDRDGGDEGQG